MFGRAAVCLLALDRVEPDDESGSARKAEASRATVVVVLVRIGEPPRQIACGRATLG